MTTEYILAEFLDATSGVSSRLIGTAAVDVVRSDQGIEVVAASTQLFLRGFEFYRSRMDKAWGMTDCLSFVIMQERGIVDAFTADHHFEQAGFRALLRE